VHRYLLDNDYKNFPDNIIVALVAYDKNKAKTKDSQGFFSRLFSTNDSLVSALRDLKDDGRSNQYILCLCVLKHKPSNVKSASFKVYEAVIEWMIDGAYSSTRRLQCEGIINSLYSHGYLTPESLKAALSWEDTFARLIELLIKHKLFNMKTLETILNYKTRWVVPRTNESYDRGSANVMMKLLLVLNDSFNIIPSNELITTLCSIKDYIDIDNICASIIKFSLTDISNAQSKSTFFNLAFHAFMGEDALAQDLKNVFTYLNRILTCNLQMEISKFHASVFSKPEYLPIIRLMSNWLNDQRKSQNMKEDKFVLFSEFLVQAKNELKKTIQLYQTASLFAKGRLTKTSALYCLPEDVAKLIVKSASETSLSHEEDAAIINGKFNEIKRKFHSN
jgi:hypothetical protein